jgi:hypothetical protein
MTEASAGLKTSKVLLDADGTHLPPMRLSLGLASQLEIPELIAGAARLAGVRPLRLPLRDVFKVRALIRR